MADTWALMALYDAVVARFAADGTAVPNLFGWRRTSQHVTTGRRIMWIPGDDGELGVVGPARYPGRNPRPLATLRELCTVIIYSADATTPEGERQQYLSCRELYDAWYRAVHLAASGTFAIESSRWVTEQLERRHGAAIRVVLSIEAMIPDMELETADADAMTAELDIEELDQTDTITVEGE